MSILSVDWIKLVPRDDRVIILEMMPKDDFSVERDQPLFEYMYEMALVEAVRANVKISVCVDARKANFVSLMNVAPMLSRFSKLVQKLHNYDAPDLPSDLVTGFLGSTSIVIESDTIRSLINMIVSVIPTRRPVEFFTSVEAAVAWAKTTM
jgi:hypothetical protein